MSARAAALIVPLALLAGCATAPRTTYHYDGRGDYYTGATPGTDVVIASPWHAGWGLGGWGPAGYGYGGGYFDRTLATMQTIAVGVGFELGRVPDTYPQQYDRPMQWVVTEAGVMKPRA